MQSIGMRFGAHVTRTRLRRDGLPSCRFPTGQPGNHRPLAARARGLGPTTCRFDPVEVDKSAASSSRMATRARRRGAPAGEAVPGAAGAARATPSGCRSQADIIQSFAYDRLKQYYADWYRPDLMAVIAVGDFDPRAMETMIRRQTSTPISSAPAPRPAAEVRRARPPGHALRGGERPGSHQYRHQRLQQDPGARSDERRLLPAVDGRAAVHGDAVGAPRRDCQEAGRAVPRGETNRSLVRAHRGGHRAQRRRDEGASSAASARCSPRRIASPASASPARSSTAPRRTCCGCSNGWRSERDASDSEPLADEYIRNFVQQEPIPGIAYEYAMHQRFLPQITLAEINGLAKEWVPDRSRVVVVSAPEKPGVTLRVSRRSLRPSPPPAARR